MHSFPCSNPGISYPALDLVPPAGSTWNEGGPGGDAPDGSATGTTEPEAQAGPWPRHRLRPGDTVLAVAVMALALLVRAPFLLRGETLLHSDECIVGVMAQDIAAGTRFPVYFYGQRYMGALEAYVIATFRFLVADPLISLRLGPACFCAILVAVQYLMFTRWFGRQGGIVAAFSLICCSPMFTQWSISARGGYIEVLLWGSLLWWSYSEWFAGRPQARARHKFWFGLLVGSGLWINPTIVAFIAPVLVHALLGAPLRTLRQHGRTGRWFRRIDRLWPRLPIVLPAVGAALVLAMSCLVCVQVLESEVRYTLLLGAVPRPVATVMLLVVLSGIAAYTLGCTGLGGWLRGRLAAAAPMLFGIIIGNSPSLCYVLEKTLCGAELEGCLPMGLRPIWTVGETLRYATIGLPLLFGADPRPFLDHVLVGRDYELHPLGDVAGLTLGMLNAVVLVASGIAAWLFLRGYGKQLHQMFRLRAATHEPAAFLALGLCGFAALYLFSGCSFDFTSVRYLVPVWGVLPGLLAAVAASRQRPGLRWGCVAALLTCWSLGQAFLFLQLGPPHPLSRLARCLREREVGFALAEPLDAHVLSFLTGQNPAVAEYQPFWPRLGHLRHGRSGAELATYLVDTREINWRADWTWPGPAPIETRRFLWPRLKKLACEHPAQIRLREPLVDGFELWTLASPLPERSRAPRG